jgi:hypothetical protein
LIRIQAASWGEIGIRAPDQWGTLLLFFVVFRTYATMPRIRTNSSVRPAKVNTSPGRSRATKFSSTEPSVRPRRN